MGWADAVGGKGRLIFLYSRRIEPITRSTYAFAKDIVPSAPRAQAWGSPARRRTAMAPALSADATATPVLPLVDHRDAREVLADEPVWSVNQALSHY
jgi:hypothetical protein